MKNRKIDLGSYIYLKRNTLSIYIMNIKMTRTSASMCKSFEWPVAELVEPPLDLRRREGNIRQR